MRTNKRLVLDDDGVARYKPIKNVRKIDFDLFVIDPKNKDTTELQLRQSIMQALETLEERIERLENEF